MKNAKKELVRSLDDITKRYSVSVKCAWITHQDYSETDIVHDHLLIGFSNIEFTDFMEKLDFDYDDGFGGQELFGQVWFDDDSWMERGEYDGSEWWEYKRSPEIPAYLNV